MTGGKVRPVPGELLGRARPPARFPRGIFLPTAIDRLRRGLAVEGVAMRLDDTNIVTVSMLMARLLAVAGVYPMTQPADRSAAALAVRRWLLEAGIPDDVKAEPAARERP